MTKITAFAGLTITDIEYNKRPTDKIGADVLNLHHGGAQKQVRKLLDDFHQGKKDFFEFWLTNKQKRFIYVSFYAIHDENGKYLGCFDFTGDVTHLRNLKGSKIKFLKNNKF